MVEKYLIDEYEQGLSSDIKFVLNLCSKAAEIHNYSIYLIGGVVRDLLLKKEIFDVDIIVEGDAIEFAKLLENSYDFQIIQVQKELKTAKVLFQNGVEIDIASTRCESYPRKGFLPVVDNHFCSLKEDVIRRDFTVNSMAMSLNSQTKYKLVDFLNGYEDLMQKKLRILHDKSFIEDPSRIIRGLKFAVRFDFDLEYETKKLQDEYLNSNLNFDMPLERVKSELIQLFSLNNPNAFDLFLSNKIYKIFCDGLSQILCGGQIFNAISEFNIKKENIWFIYFASVLAYLNSDVVSRFNLSSKEQKIISGVKFLLRVGRRELNTHYDVYVFFNKQPELSVIIYYALTNDFKAKVYIEKLKNIKLLISGNDLIDLGITPSDEFSLLFQKVLAQKINFGLNTKDDEISYLRSILKSFD